MTKSDITRPSQKEALKERLMEAGVPEYKIIFTCDEQAAKEGCEEEEGCKKLMQLSYEMLPEAFKDAFMFAQQVDKEAKKIDWKKNKVEEE